MTTSPYDAYRPPDGDRRRKRRRGGGRRGGRGGRGWMNRGADGGREMPMVEDVEFTSYYGRPIVKAPPWGDEIGAYLFLGGLAGGSALLGLGGQLTDRPALRRNTRLTSLVALGAGTLALVEDLGRPERFLNMMRTVKITSPMSLGSWILGGFGSGAGVVAVLEVDRLTGERIPLGPLEPLRRVLEAVETPLALTSVLFATPLASYTGVLLGATAVPTWNAAGRNGLPVVFAASACVAAGGTAMVTTPVAQAGPARLFALAGTAAELVAMKAMKDRMHPVEVEPMETGEPGRKLHRAEVLTIAGGVATAALEVGVRLLDRKGRGGAGRTALRVGLQVASAAAGAALAAASAYTRFGMLEAGIESTKDPRHVVEPQRDRLAARQAAGITHDSITTIG
ncbi:NrfD/PsrC family molybdoenzyme membrane anchor subunit [Brevibacterium yomogidense]|uniref:NrfD/PsrC family molybdoenzyme membrane anchor subunit n=1 Tax=Brevibacterium yomogidense TaxID=946573 RepID=UPI0018DF4D7D|nr:NrfD/PsrC family molybdoenzyme membrane anchor subunit [Brevibacterium yomogidense]